MLQLFPVQILLWGDRESRSQRVRGGQSMVEGSAVLMSFVIRTLMRTSAELVDSKLNVTLTYFFVNVGAVPHRGSLVRAAKCDPHGVR